MIPLRPYQLRSIDRLREAIASGKRRVILVAPTGSGKTVTAAHIIESAVSRGSHVLFMAHRRELIKQCFAKLVRFGLDPEAIGIIMAGTPTRLARPPSDLDRLTDDELYAAAARRRPQAPIQIASIGSLHRPAKPRAELVIIDEAHRALAKSYRDIADEYPTAVHLGLTGTPIRSDNNGLDQAYDDIVLVASYQELVSDGYLVRPKVWTVPAEQRPDVTSVRMRGDDYDPGQLSQAADKPKLIGDMIDHWLRRGQGRPTFAYAVSVEHSKHCAAEFCAAGIPAAHVDGSTPHEERAAALRKLATGEIKVLWNVDVFTEGVDVPSVKTIILGRPTASVRIYLQQVGRGSRPFEGQEFTVLDHAGCAIAHGRPDDDRDWSLVMSQRPRKGQVTEERAKPCPSCQFVCEVTARVCPECGFEFVGKPRQAETGPGELVEMPPASMDEKRSFWDELCRTRGSRKPGWVYHKYVAKFIANPPRDWKVPLESAELTPEAKRATWEQYQRDASKAGHKPGAARMRYHGRFNEWPEELTTPIQKRDAPRMERWL